MQTFCDCEKTVLPRDRSGNEEKTGGRERYGGEGVGEKGYRQTTIMHGDKHREKFARKADVLAWRSMIAKLPGICVRHAKRELTGKRKEIGANKREKRTGFI